MEIPLDHNFPQPILNCLREFVADVELRPLRDIHPVLTELDDRQLVLALDKLGFSSLITSNYKMLQNPRELAAVMKTHMTVFAIEGVGHDPLRATGALLLDLPGAVARMSAGGGGGGVYWLRPRNPRPKTPWELFMRAAKHQNADPNELYADLRVHQEEIDALPVEIE